MKQSGGKIQSSNYVNLFDMDRVKRYIFFLRCQSSVGSSVQRKSLLLLETASTDRITALAEIAYNILGGVFSLTVSELSSVQHYKSVLRCWLVGCFGFSGPLR